MLTYQILFVMYDVSSFHLQEDVQSWIQEAEDLKSLNLVKGLAAKLGKHLITKIEAVESIAMAVSRALEENRKPRQRKGLREITLIC